MDGILDRPTLVLNRNWQPINVVSVQRALKLVWKDGARFVCPDTYQLFDWDAWLDFEPTADDPHIQGVKRRVRAPEVIGLSEFNRLPVSLVTFSRRNVFKRDHYTCQYCNVQPGNDDLTIDHVVPRSQGGQSTWENCVLSCSSCNFIKADRTPEEANMKLLNEPTKPSWKPLYSSNSGRLDSWNKFISDSYWDAELEP